MSLPSPLNPSWSRCVGVAVFFASIGGCVIVDEDKDVDQDAEDAEGSESTWGSPDEDSGEPVGEDGLSVTVDWGDSSVSIEVAEGGAWLLGMAETGGSCGDEIPCWTGEDCFEGFVSGDATYGPWCHSLADGATTLDYGGQLADFEAGRTVFQAEFSGTVTYLLVPDGAERAESGCYVFGDRPAYFAELGCTTLVP